jgi:hypothetical protein
MHKFLILYIFSFMANAALAFTYTLKLSEAELQTRITSVQPIQQQRFGVTVVFTDVKIGLIPVSDEISFSSPLDVIIPSNLKATGAVTMRGKLRYDENLGEFFLNAPVIDDIKVDGVTPSMLAQIKPITQYAARAILAKHSIYKLDNSLKQKLAKALLKSVNVKDKTLFIVLGL